jgi:hypothetical protein
MEKEEKRQLQCGCKTSQPKDHRRFHAKAIFCFEFFEQQQKASFPVSASKNENSCTIFIK